MVLIVLERIVRKIIGSDVEDKEYRIFETIQEAERWLKENNFYYGQRIFFSYTPKDAKEWCHMNDDTWEYVNVTIEDRDVWNEPSYYRNFYPGREDDIKKVKQEMLVELVEDRVIPVEVAVEKLGISKVEFEKLCENSKD